MHIPPGSRLGAFEIVGLIGAGGMGEVYRAMDSRLGRQVALKVLPEAVASDPERIARFKREARVLASLDAELIVRKAGTGVEAGVVFEGPADAGRYVPMRNCFMNITVA